MTDLDRDIMRILRVFGPCSNAEVGRRLGILPDKTYRRIRQLEAANLVSHPRLQQWQLTRRGERVFETEPNRPLGLFEPAAAGKGE